ncbi:hypothetical protein B0H15DRAFT_852678 [Mycena belliarum]|uniref:Uncharacterized protein n=1 Tax=Mycena belliarum TaxID=1033014 RepID=A0AAD6TWU8_9AGAR|nr:hypothetical protein B0H15DRAFT_852678 [Mycena belliae]
MSGILRRGLIADRQLEPQPAGDGLLTDAFCGKCGVREKERSCSAGATRRASPIAKLSSSTRANRRSGCSARPVLLAPTLEIMPRHRACFPIVLPHVYASPHRRYAFPRNDLRRRPPRLARASPRWRVRSRYLAAPVHGPAPRRVLQSRARARAGILQVQQPRNECLRPLSCIRLPRCRPSSPARARSESPSPHLRPRTSVAARSPLSFRRVQLTRAVASCKTRARALISPAAACHVHPCALPPPPPPKLVRDLGRGEEARGNAKPEH